MLSPHRCVMRKHAHFENQETILTSIVRNLSGAGGLAIGIVERPWFHQFMKDGEPKFRSSSRIAVKRKLNELYQQERSSLLHEVNIVCKPTVTLDFWTGSDDHSFMGCTIRYIHERERELKSAMLFFHEVPPPHTSENVRIKFEDELVHCGVSCFQIVTDNAPNMKSAFRVSPDDEDDSHDDTNETIDSSYWSPQPLIHFDGWIAYNLNNYFFK